METTKKVIAKNAKAENKEAQAILDSLNANNLFKGLADKPKSGAKKGATIWTQEFRLKNNGKISQTHRANLANYLGRIADFVSRKNFEKAKEDFKALKVWANGKLIFPDFNLENLKQENYCSKQPNTGHLQADWINAGLNAIKFLYISKEI